MRFGTKRGVSETAAMCEVSASHDGDCESFLIMADVAHRRKAPEEGKVGKRESQVRRDAPAAAPGRRRRTSGVGTSQSRHAGRAEEVPLPNLVLGSQTSRCCKS